MKKIFAIMLVIIVLFDMTACDNIHIFGNDDVTVSGQHDMSKLNEDELLVAQNVTYLELGEGLLRITVKTSSLIWQNSGWLGVCPVGEFVDEIDADNMVKYRVYMGMNCDEDWFCGIHHFDFDLNMIRKGKYSMVLCDRDDAGLLIGQWKFTKNEDNTFDFDFDGAFMEGAGESPQDKKFDTEQEKIESWFSFDESDPYFVYVEFKGFMLDTSKNPWMGVCPKSEYEKEFKANLVDLSYADLDSKCPYVFPVEIDKLPYDDYTLVLCDSDEKGNVLVQFGFSVHEDEITYDFSNAKCSVDE